VGLQNFREVIADRSSPSGEENRLLRRPRLLFGSRSSHCGSPDQRVAPFRGIYSALAYYRRHSAVVGVMLWKYVFYEPSSVVLFNTVLGWIPSGAYGWLQSARHRYARARPSESRVSAGK